MMLGYVERSLISIEHRLQHHPTSCFVLRGEQQCCSHLATVFNIVGHVHAHDMR